MRRMFSEEQLKKIVKDFLASNEDFEFGGDVDIDGDLSVSGAINGEENPSVKPIYCHPIVITYSSPQIRVTCLIFNNDPTPFTLSTFKDWIDDLYTKIGDTIRIMMSGAYYLSGDNHVLIASYFFKGVTNYGISGLIETGASESVSNINFNSVFPADCSFTDGVNKIN